MKKKQNGTAHPTLRKFQKSRERSAFVSVPIINNLESLLADVQGTHFHRPRLTYVISTSNKKFPNHARPLQ